MNEQLQALLETLKLSEGTASKIKTMLEEAMKACKEEGKKEAEEEAEKEKEAMEESHAEEVAYLKEKANEYGDFLKEHANDYGDFLKEKANDYGSFLMEKANEYGETIKESVSDKMKEYADYAVEQFITENKERFVETEDYARMKSAFDYIEEAFEKNAYSVNENAAVTELQESMKESAAKFEALFEDLSEARAELDKVNRTLLVERATADLADTQKEKVNELLEAVSFDSIDEFKDGIAMIVEQAKTVSTDVKNNDTQLNENTNGVPNKNSRQLDPSVAALMNRPGLF